MWLAAAPKHIGDVIVRISHGPAMLKKLLKIFVVAMLALLLLLVVAGFAGWYVWEQETAPSRIQKSIKGEFHRAARGEIMLRWASLSPALRLHLEGIAITPPERDRDILNCERARVQFDFEQFLRGNRVPRRVELVRPEMFLDRDPDTDGWNFEGMIRPVDDAPAEEPPRALLEDGFYAEDGLVSLRAPMIFKSSRPRTIEGINLHLSRRSPASVNYDFTGNISRGALRGMSIDGWVGEDAFGVRSRIDNLQVDRELLDRIPLGNKLEEIFKPRGPISGQLSLSASEDAEKPAYSARLGLRGLTSRTKFYDARLEEMGGEIIITDGRVIFRNVTGHIPPAELGLGEKACQPSSVGVDGTYYMKPEGARVKINARDLPLTEESVGAIPEVGEEVWDAIHPEGLADLDLTVEDQQRGELRFTTSATMRGVSLKVDQLPFDLAEMEGRVDIDEDRVELRDVGGVVEQDGHSPRIFLNGVFNTKGEPLDLNVDLKGLHLDEKTVRAIPDFGDELWELLQPRGMAQSNIQIRQSGDDTRVSGTVEFARGSIRTELSPMPLHDVSARVRFDHEGIEISRMSGRVERDGSTPMGDQPEPGRVEITGELARDGRSGTLDLDAPLLTLSDQLVRALPSVGEELWNELHPEGLAALYSRISYDLDQDEPVSYRVRLNLHDGRAEWALTGARMRSLNGTVLVNNEGVRIPRMAGKIAGGPFDAWGTVSRRDDGGVKYSGSMEFRRLVLPHLLEQLTDEQHDFKGRLSGLVEVSGRTGEDQHVEGTGTTNLTEGKVWRAPFFLGLVNVLQLSSPGRYGNFDRGEVSFDFNTRQLTINSFRLNSPAAEMTGSGTIGLGEGAVDMEMYAATPSEGGVPVIGEAIRWVLKPVQRQLSRVRISGTLEEPHYRMTPLKTVTGPIGSVFHFLTSPFRGDPSKEYTGYQDDE